MGREELLWWAEEARRIRALRLIDAAKSAAVPHMTEEARENYMAMLLNAARTPEERVEAERAQKAQQRENWSMLRTILGGKR